MKFICVVAVTALCCAGQEALRFAVASVRPVSQASPNGYNHTVNPGGISMLGVSLGYVVRLAYGLTVQRPYELVGPVWLNPPTDVLVSIVAKTDEPASEEHIKLMLQTLLKERFHFTAHREDRELPVYDLVVTKKDMLRPATPGAEMKIKSGKGQELLLQSVTMDQFALQLGHTAATSRPVINKTGLDGTFDFKLDLGPYITDPETGKPVVDAIGRIDVEGATIRALKEQLGMELKPDRGSISVLVIDHLDKTPTGN